MVCEPKSPHSSFAVLDAKAAEMKYLGPPLLEVVQALLDSEDEVQGAMVQCLHAWCSIIKCLMEQECFSQLKNTAWWKTLAKGSLPPMTS